MTGPREPRPRLRRSRIEPKPKTIGDQHFVDHVGVKDPHLRADLNLLLDQIAKGLTVDERYYRSGIDRDSDGLLETHGVMHLHLGGPYSDVLLFLVQYDNHVELLEINDHKHFRSKPVGALIAALQSSWIKNLDRELAAAETLARSQAADVDRDEAIRRAADIKAAILRSGLRPRGSQ